MTKAGPAAEARKPRVDKISGSYFKRGRCTVCGKTADRSATFSAPTYAEMLAQGETWSQQPVMHKKCERA